jgi:hypothetical protein
MPICTPFVDTSFGRITVHTSFTRPTGADRYPGKYIYESDTNRTLVWDGTGWVIQNEPTNVWTPSFSGVSLGNGTQTGIYKRSDGWVDFTAIFTLGNTSTVTGPVLTTLPINAASTFVTTQNEVYFYDQSANIAYPGVVIAVSTTQVTVQAMQTASTYAFGTAVTSLIPLTTGWAQNDFIQVAGRYQMTTRYS